MDRSDRQLNCASLREHYSLLLTPGFTDFVSHLTHGYRVGANEDYVPHRWPYRFAALDQKVISCRRKGDGVSHPEKLYHLRPRAMNQVRREGHGGFSFAARTIASSAGSSAWKQSSRRRLVPKDTGKAWPKVDRDIGKGGAEHAEAMLQSCARVYVPRLLSRTELAPAGQ